MSLIKSPFSDAIGPDSVPHKGSGPGEYNAAPAPGLPSRDGGLLPELTYDKHAGSPSVKGPIQTSFKDAVS